MTWQRAEKEQRFMVGVILSRRHLMGAAGAGLGAVVRSRIGFAAQDAPAPPVEMVTTDGIAGGGTLINLGNEVSFSVAVFAREQDGAEPLVHGTFRLIDQGDPNSPVVLESELFNSITAFSKNEPSARQIQGWARVNGNGPFPFLLQVEDVGEPGSGADTFNLVFGDAAVPFLGGDAKNCDCGGYSYSLRSNVIAGDLALFALA
jgi:hypothetical protein